MSTMGCSKRIVYVHIGKGGQLVGKTLIALFLLLIEPEVLQKQDISLLQRAGQNNGVITNTIGGKFHVNFQQLAEQRDKVFQRIFIRGSILGPA